MRRRIRCRSLGTRSSNGRFHGVDRFPVFERSLNRRLAPLTPYSQGAPVSEARGIVATNMDRSLKPGDDFFRYANGTWIKRTAVPADSGYVAVGGWAREDQSTESSRRRTAAIIEEAIKADAPAGSTTRKIADLYRSFMDEAGVEAKGLAPVQPHLEVIAAIRDKRDLARVFGRKPARRRRSPEPSVFSYSEPLRSLDLPGLQ